MKRVEFTVPGEPRGKGRPRFRRVGNYVQTYTPDETASYENLVKVEYQNQCAYMFDREDPLTMQIIAYYGIPKSVSKKKRNQMLDGEILPLKKPDADNVLKVIADALNGVAYHDDVQLVTVHIDRAYADVPRVEVTIISNDLEF